MARGMTAAAVATLLAGLSHTVGGAVVPFGVGSVIAFAFAALVCIGLAGRSLALWRIAASVVLSQLAFHALFTLSGSGVVLEQVGAHHHGSVLVHDVAAHVHAGPPMIGAHLIAAVVTIIALHRGEALLISLGALAARAVRVLFGDAPVPAPVSVARIAASGALELPYRQRMVLSVMRHRGPPVLASF